MFILALLPILLILILMVGFSWGAARAGAAGYLSALLVAALFYGAGAQLLAYAHMRAVLLAVDVLLIIWAAFLLYMVVDEAGAFRTIGQALPHLTNDTGMQALIIGWVFASFLQGVGGFGVPVAVVSPILASLGFSPLAAVIIPSIGHGWSVTFGSLGSSFLALLAATNQPDSLVGPPTAVFLGISALLIGIFVAHAAGGFAAVKRLVAPALAIGAVMAVVQYLVVRSGAWNIGAFMGSISGLLIAIPLARRYRGEQASNNGKLDFKALALALAGYVLLVVITLSIQLIPVIRDFLGGVVIQVKFPQTATSLGFITPAAASRKIVLFRHAGAALTYTSILSYLLYQRAGCYRAGATRRILGGLARKVMPSTVSIVSMVTMAAIMENSGMTDTLARGMSQGLGAIYPVVAPWIGAIGAFMTGSNTNSNVVFGALQLLTARLLNYPAAILLAAQTSGAALASVIAPSKVVVGTSTVGMSGQEGLIIRKMLPYMVWMVLLISLLTVISVRLYR